MAKICVLLYLLLTVIKSQVEGCVETFPDLLNSITVCSNLTKQCNVSCVENHIYYDGDNTKTYSCNDDNIWSPFVPKTGCLDQTRAILWMRFNVSYKTTEVAAYCLQAHQQALIENEDVLTQQVSLYCNSKLFSVGRISINKTTSTASSFKINTVFELEIGDSSTINIVKEACRQLLIFNVKSENFMVYGDSLECITGTSNLTKMNATAESGVSRCPYSYFLVEDSENDEYCVPPQTPTNFSLVSPTETSILVEWTPVYSDDHEQTFYLEYRTRRTETWSLKEISHNTKQLTSLTYILSGLQDSTLYELKMYSKNKFGRSLSTDIDIIQTREKQEKASGFYAVIGGMAGVIAVLVIIVIILKRKKGCSSGARNNISNRSDNIGEMFSPSRTTSDMYEEIREDTRNEDLQQRGGNTSTTTCEMLAMQDIPNTYGDLSSEQEQRQSESTTEQYETLGEQDKPNVYEEIKNKQEPEDREYINLQL